MLAISLTLVVLWRLEGAGAAINDAGRLRMQTYRIALLTTKNIPKAELELELTHFDETLQGIISGDKKRPLFLPKEPMIYNQAQLIQSEWKILSSLIINRWYKEDLQQERVLKVANIDLFVDHINELVVLIEKDNTSRLTYLRTYQYLLYALVIIGIFSTLYLFVILIIRPLANLNQGMHFITKGQFNYRIKLQQNDEFGLLGLGFNQMASKLEDIYNHLEEKVAEKTQNLEEKNNTLSNLYQITTLMHNSHDIPEICQMFLEQIVPIMTADAASIRFINSEQQTYDLIAAFNLPNTARIDHNTLTVFPLFKGKEQLGELTLFFNNPEKPTEEQVNLLTTLSSHLCSVINGIQTLIQLRQMAVLEERNLLARDLHDSIAQVLTFLNIQVQMLERALRQGNQMQSQDSLTAIKNGVQECYENVRELLLNFRMPEKKESFRAMVGEIVARFEAQTGINVTCNFSTIGSSPDTNETMEIVFILQEGFSNIRKHAKATEVILTIEQMIDFELTLQDNGIGFDQQMLQDKSINHVGMAIMHERAQKINAMLIITATVGMGTKLVLKLPDNKESL